MTAPIRLEAAVFLTALAMTSILGCKHGDDGAPDASAMPAPTATVTAAPPAEPTSAATDTAAPAVPVVHVASKTDAGSPLDAGAAEPGKGVTADAGVSPGAKVQACFQKCQQILQGCLTAGFGLGDGGVPQLKDPVGCQKATDACKAACQ